MDDDNEGEVNGDDTPSKPKAKGRGKKAAAAVKDEEGSPTPKKPKAGPKKRKAAAADDNEDELAAESAVVAPKKRKSGHLALMEAGNEDEAPMEKPAKKSRAKKVKKEEAEQVDGPTDPEPEPKPTPTKKGKGKREAALKAEVADLRTEMEEEPEVPVGKPTGKRGRSKREKAIKAEEAAEAADMPVEAEPEEEAAPELDETAPKARGGRRKGTAKTKAK